MEALREIIFEDEMETEVNSCRDQQYQRSNMQRSAIMNRLRQAGCRITKQRKIILDIILQEECTCCKEIYFLASKRDPNIGMATIYRMINLLEEIGALKRKRAYRICNEESPVHICSVKLDDYTSIRLDGEKLRQDRERHGIFWLSARQTGTQYFNGERRITAFHAPFHRKVYKNPSKNPLYFYT